MVSEAITGLDLRVHYGGVHAVDGVSLKLLPGRLHGLVGPNGSGKSTLLAALSRMTELTDGALSLEGRRYEKLPAAEVARMGIRRTFQTVRLLQTMSVLENIMVGADSLFLDRGILQSWVAWRRTARHDRLCRETAMEAIELLGLSNHKEALCGTLPYGTQRRVEIARAVASKPTVLLLDEPTAGMGRAERDEMGGVFVALSAQGLTQLLVEHDVDLITDVSDHLYVMNMGRLIAEGTPSDVVRLPVVQDAYLGRR